MPKHLLTARNAVGMKAPPWSYKSPWLCYQFVNKVLDLALPSEIFNQLIQFRDEILKEYPHSYQAEEVIPYHYSLIAEHLKTGPKDFLKSFNIFEAKQGDILIYIAPQYNPDLSHPRSRASGGTHVAFIDEVIKCQADEPIVMRLIDASGRVSGRRFHKERYSTQEPFPEEGAIAYNYLTITKRDEKKNLWKCHLDNENAFNKHLYILRFCY